MGAHPSPFVSTAFFASLAAPLACLSLSLSHCPCDLVPTVHTCSLLFHLSLFICFGLPSNIVSYPLGIDIVVPSKVDRPFGSLYWYKCSHEVGTLLLFSQALILLLLFLILLLFLFFTLLFSMMLSLALKYCSFFVPSLIHIHVPCHLYLVLRVLFWFVALAAYGCIWVSNSVRTCC